MPRLPLGVRAVAGLAHDGAEMGLVLVVQPRISTNDPLPNDSFPPAVFLVRGTVLYSVTGLRSAAFSFRLLHYPFVWIVGFGLAASLLLSASLASILPAKQRPSSRTRSLDDSRRTTRNTHTYLPANIHSRHDDAHGRRGRGAQLQGLVLGHCPWQGLRRDRVPAGYAASVPQSTALHPIPRV